MSTDNGVYVLGTVRNRRMEGRATVACKPYKVYRIAHAQAIDNFDYYKENQLHNLGCYMQQVWGASKVYEDKDKALADACTLAATIDGLEYGVTLIDTEYKMYQD